MNAVEASDDLHLEIDSTPVSEVLLQEVSEWKLEAKNEDNDRYFYHVDEVASIESGKRCYVIGRKGSGKTAISEYLSGIIDHETFSEKLTFKNFPFNALYELRNDSYAAPNQYITLWKYLIYNTICQMMLRNQNINPQARDQLDKVYGKSDLSLDRRIGKWTAREFQIGALTFNLKIGGAKEKADDAPWIERVNILEDFIRENVDSSKYYVIFDELDEDYRDIVSLQKYEDYTALVTSLFKAVQDVKSIFKADGSRIMPVVFLRDDIYEVLKDSDKNKWSDFKIELFWDEEKARKLVAFRITRALDPNAQKPLPFNAAWKKLIGASFMRYGTHRKSKMDSFSYISRSTYLRPRDFVKILQECASRALGTNQKRITSSIVSDVDSAYSNYLKDELTDELFAILPNITEIFDAVTQIGKWNFSYQDFQRSYASTVERDASPSKINFILQVLFIFSVVGTALRHDYAMFRYMHKDARMNYKNRIIVHRGLFKSLQIV